jgi:hypothetical protein
MEKSKKKKKKEILQLKREKKISLYVSRDSKAFWSRKSQ